jgi:hypothetical protein
MEVQISRWERGVKRDYLKVSGAHKVISSHQGVLIEGYQRSILKS